jgi:cytochrome P450
MLGVPEHRHDDFRRWSHTIVGGHAYGRESDEVLVEMRQASDEVNGYLTDELERHRRGGFDDVLSTLLDMAQMSAAEMRSTALLLLLAGYDTTAKLMATSLVTLERHPDQRRKLAENPALLASALEEVLRWQGVAHIVPRAVVRGTTLAGQALAEGDAVYCLTAAANRDPDRWPEPDRFDILREAKSHLGFGYGPHLCIGLWLARLEARVALRRLLELAPDYRLRDIRSGSSYHVRGPESGFVDTGVGSPVTV